MENQIRHIAEQLKMDLQRDVESGKHSLADFASQYALKNDLKYNAIILNLNYTNASQIETKERLREEIFSLIDEIVADYEINAETASRAKQTQKLLENYYLSIEPANQVVFESKGLGKFFRKSGFHLQDINLELKLGEITSVVGENGNGKTTLFRVVAGEVQHDEGSLCYPMLGESNSDKIDWFNVKSQIAYVPQELPKWYGSLISNIHFEMSSRGIKGEENLRETNYIIQRLGLEDYLNRKWKELSGGYKLRFALAKALVWKPKLLLIDEPLANLDIKAQQIVLNDLRNLAKSLRYPIAVMISSQHLHEIESVSDKILFLKDGKVTYYGDTHSIGESRAKNTFELGCRENIQKLREKLQAHPGIDIQFNGMHFIIETPLEIEHQQLLKLLLNAEIEILYFRNISQSVKRLFEMS